MEFKERKLQTYSLTSDNCHQHRNLGVSQIKEKRNILSLFLSSWYRSKRKVIFQAKNEILLFLISVKTVNVKIISSDRMIHSEKQPHSDMIGDEWAWLGL